MRKKKFKIYLLKLGEIKYFVRKARTMSSPRINRISTKWKFNKRCHKFFATFREEAHRTKFMSASWELADRIPISKEKDSRKLDQFQPISLLNVKVNIFFGDIAKKITRFVINNGYVNSSIQRLEVPAFHVVLNKALFCGTE